mgnify:CR=1 FL=1
MNSNKNVINFFDKNIYLCLALSMCGILKTAKYRKEKVMRNEAGEWIIHGVTWDDPKCIHDVDEAVEYINRVGFLPLFKNEIPGFSLEERTVAEYWWSDDPVRDPWRWRIAIAKKHGIELKNPDYVQIHPTTFYTKKHEDRSFLISESVRGEGAKLLDKNMNRFVNELLPRDVLTGKIREQMKKDGTDFVWEDLRTIPRDELVSHFPNIIEHCKEMGYDVFKEPIPVVPAQHYFMGGVKVNHHSRTSMECLYAVGETACNGVHGRNRLASNSLLESLVFAKRAAGQMAELGFVNDEIAAKKAADSIDLADYSDEKAVEREYRKLAMEAIEGRTSVENESGVTYIQA